MVVQSHDVGSVGNSVNSYSEEVCVAACGHTPGPVVAQIEDFGTNVEGRCKKNDMSRQLQQVAECREPCRQKGQAALHD